MIPDESKRLKAFRKAFGISQIEASEALGVNQSQFSKIERGEYSLTIDHVKALNKSFGLSYTWLFTGIGKMKLDVVEKRSTLHDLKEVLMENAILKEKVAKLESDFKELHAAFYAFKYGSKA